MVLPTPQQPVPQPPAAFIQSPAPAATIPTVLYESIPLLMTVQPRAPTAHHPQIQPLMTPIPSTAPQQAPPQRYDSSMVTRGQTQEQPSRSCRVIEASDLPSNSQAMQQAAPQEGSRQGKLKLLMQQQALRAQSSSTGAIPSKSARLSPHLRVPRSAWQPLRLTCQLFSV